MATKTGTLSAVGNTTVSTVGNNNLAVLFIGGTFSEFNATFEVSGDSTNGSDGTWFPTTAANAATNSAGTATGIISVPGIYRVCVSGVKYIRVRATAITSGSVDVRVVTSTTSIDPSPVVPAHPVTQSGAWNLGAVSTITNPVEVTQSGVWSVVPVKATTGGLSRQKILSTASTNATLVKAAAGTVYAINLNNSSATSARYVKLFNKATAPVVGTDVPVETYVIPASTSLRLEFSDFGVAFSTGIGFAVTGGVGDLDTTATLPNEVVGVIHYA